MDHVLLAIGWLILLGVTGLAIGLRPSRHDFPARLLLTLALYSAFVGLAGWGLWRPDWIRPLMDWFGDPDGFLLVIICEPIVVIGLFVLTPLWGYAAGRSLRWLRTKYRRHPGNDRSPTGHYSATEH